MRCKQDGFVYMKVNLMLDRKAGQVNEQGEYKSCERGTTERE